MKADRTSQSHKFHIFSSDSVAKELTLSIEKVDFDGSKGADLIESSEDITQLRLLCAVPFYEYRQVFDQGWLNLNSKKEDIGDEKLFNASRPVQIEIALASSLRSQLLDMAKTAAEAVIALERISQTQLEHKGDVHPLLQEQSWYCTVIKQSQKDGEETIHHTLWHYLLPTLQDPTPEGVAASITQYIRAQTTASLGQITQATDPLFQDIAQTFQDLFTDALTDRDHQDIEDIPLLLTALTEFLTAENWPYATLSNAEETPQITNIRLSFRGENGQWSCYASVDEARKTLCFYSIAPVMAEPSQCGAIAHFITRANYGLILGNFELDYTDGEIRYKTSLDVEGDRLTPALIKNLIYTNVMTMDQYLPGLVAVRENQMTPEQAIHQMYAPSV